MATFVGARSGSRLFQELSDPSIDHACLRGPQMVARALHRLDVAHRPLQLTRFMSSKLYAVYATDVATLPDCKISKNS
jgi:hypothetical protein